MSECTAVSSVRFLFALSVFVTTFLVGCVVRTFGLFSHHAQPFFFSRVISPRLDERCFARHPTVLGHFSSYAISLHVFYAHGLLLFISSPGLVPRSRYFLWPLKY